MGFFVWDDQTLALKVKKMDDEHKTIVDLMNKLYDHNAAGAGKPELEKIIGELAKYTLLHFSDEEAYMESIAYPELAVHKKIHQQLIQKLEEHVANYKAAPGRALPTEFFIFLQTWLRAHIMGVDRKYAAHSRVA